MWCPGGPRGGGGSGGLGFFSGRSAKRLVLPGLCPVRAVILFRGRCRTAWCCPAPGRQSSVGQRGCYSCPLAFTPGVKSSGAAGRPCSPAGGLCSRALLEQETRSAQPADWRGGKTKLGSDQQDCCHENRALTATAWLPRQPKTSAGAARDFPPWLPRAAPRREIRRRCPGRTVRLKEEKRCCGGVPAGPEPALCVTK